MSSILVIRGAGDKQGDDIVDALLSTVPAQIARGVAELDTYSTLQQTVDLEIVYRPGLALGQLVEVHDSLQGQSYKGKVTSISHQVNGTSVTTRLSILRPIPVP